MLQIRNHVHKIVHLYEEHNGIFYANVQPFEAYIMVTDSCILEKLHKKNWKFVQ